MNPDRKNRGRQDIQIRNENAEAFKSLVESVKDYAIFLLDSEGYIATWNPGAERTKGYTAQEIIGKHFSIFYTNDAKEIHHPEYELKCATRDGRYEEEGWRVRKDGSTFWANVVISALYDDEGAIRGFAKVTRDMTERKRVEEELRQSRDILEQRVRERTAELTKTNRDLRTEMDRRRQLEEGLRDQAQQLQAEANHKDQFLAMLAHELRNPMGALSNAIHVLLLSPPDSLAHQRARKVVVRQMAHQVRLVDDLLDVSRISRGKMELIQCPFDLVQLISDAAEDLRAMFDAESIALTVDLPSDPVKVVGDPTRLTQIIGNLLDNAKKFSGPGGTVTLRLSVDAVASKARISVQDVGVGIESHMLPRLFEPFAQADRSLDRSRGGLGLGLALVKGLTELHGGTVSARSEGAGRGAEFTITLPIRSGIETARDVTDRTESPSALRVLVIEDIRDAAETLRDLLELFGYRVELAYDGQEGLQKALESQPEVIICDIGLPGIDGYTLASELRNHQSMMSTPLVAVTGYGKTEDRRRTKDAGFNAHLTKPIDPDELRQVLDQVTHHSDKSVDFAGSDNDATDFVGDRDRAGE